jgi:SAM-dependent methyltransferase
MNNNEKQLAERFRRYASFTTDTDPIPHYYGENPGEEIDRLLDIYTNTNTRFLDVGCGAGQTIARIAPKVSKVWGIDMVPDLLNGARQRVKELELTNVTLIDGNASDDICTDKLPNDYFDLAISRRGPDFNPLLLSKLRKNAIVIQERVGNLNLHPLRYIFGRTAYAPYNYNIQAVLLSKYAGIGLFPVSFKEYFYEAFYRDINHLEADLEKSPWSLHNWRVGEARPYEASRDRKALELFAQYNSTSRGIRILEHRMIFVLRQAKISYYPVDGLRMDNV